MPSGVGVVGVLQECGVRGSYCCFRLKLALELAGVQPNYPHREQSHQQLCQQYHSRDGSLHHNSCRICCLRCFFTLRARRVLACMPRVCIASKSWHRSGGHGSRLRGRQRCWCWSVLGLVTELLLACSSISMSRPLSFNLRLGVLGYSP